MATKQLIETSIWKDKWFRDLDKRFQILFFYLLTNESINPAGMYEIDEIYINHALNIKNCPFASTGSLISINVSCSRTGYL